MPDDTLRVALTNLLAVIHRDGGQYAHEHGIDKAAQDAGAIFLDLSERAEKLQRCKICKHDPPEGEPDKDCICGGSQTIEGQIAGLNACIQYWRGCFATEAALKKG